MEKWLRKHNKGDLHECTWEEILECMKACGYTCPMAERAIVQPERRG